MTTLQSHYVAEQQVSAHHSDEPDWPLNFSTKFYNRQINEQQDIVGSLINPNTSKQEQHQQNYQPIIELSPDSSHIRNVQTTFASYSTVP